MEYKQNYSAEELTELVEWFKENSSRIPDSLKVNESTSYFELRKRLPEAMNNVRRLGGFSTYSGLVHQYIMLKEAIEKELNK